MNNDREPITVCSWCKRVKVGPYWLAVELPADAPVTHGICPECSEKSFPCCEHCDNPLVNGPKYCPVCGAVREG